MRKCVVLTLGKGSWETGFSTVTVQLRKGNDAFESQFSGSLPGNLDLLKQYQDWRTYYKQLTKSQRSPKKNKGITFDPKDESLPQVSTRKFEEICTRLKEEFNCWLNAESFTPIYSKLRTYLNANDEIQFIIGVDDPEVYQFSWHLWSLFEDYPKAEVSVSILDYEKVASETYSPKRKARILTVLGNSTGIDTRKDEILLKQLKQVKIVSLVEPDRAKFDRQLWNSEGLDILFFAGHSYSDESGLKGKMKLNSTTTLSVSQIRFALKHAIAQGLQLVILNSCDGIGLARELADLSIPQLIVMREPVPDKVAQEFLLHFLEFFARGEDLYASVRKARQRLQGLEGTYPCASWLPVICQNPALPSLRLPVQSTTTIKSHLCRLGLAVAVSLLSSVLVMGVRSLKLLQKIELNAYDHFMSLSPHEKIDSRITIVTIDEKETDSKKYNYPIPDAILAEAIESIQQQKPVAIGMDIHRPAARDPEGYQNLINLFQQNPNLVGVCSYRDSDTSHGPPSGLSQPEIENQIGFSNLSNDEVFDPLETVRRHQFSYDMSVSTSVSSCTAPISFSLQLAYRFLYLIEDIQPEKDQSAGQEQWKFGDALFPRMNRKFGGYQDMRGGDDVLIRYRSVNPGGILSSEKAISPGRRISLSQILADEFPNDAINGKIVLIGYTLPEQDTFNTPYGEQPGVFVHAHMVSQILSAVLDERMLVWVLPQWKAIQWGDAVYIFTCSTAIGLVLLNSQKFRYGFLVLPLSFIILYGLGYAAFLGVLWLPLVPSFLAAGITSTLLILYNPEKVSVGLFYSPQIQSHEF